MSAMRLRFGLAVLAVVVILVAVLVRGRRPDVSSVRESTAVVPATRPPDSLPATANAGAPVQATTNASGAADPDLAVFQSADFKRTSVHERWVGQDVTDADIGAALAWMKDQGFTGAQLRDPSLVSQFLPAHNIEPVYVDEISLPATAAAGQPVPFTVKANFPSPAYTFEKWEIRPDGARIVVRPVGSKVGTPVAAVIVPVSLDGSIPGLSPGDYTVRFEAIGEPVERQLTIR